jgi:hypothetical protein
MAVHHPPESVFMINQNRCSRWAGICTPTFVTLTLLQPFATVAEALAHFSARPPAQIAPKVVKTANGSVYLYDGDAGHASENPDLPGARHRLLQPKGGDWQYLGDL